MRCLLPLLLCAALTASVRAADAPQPTIVYPRADSTGGYRLHVMNADGTGDKELPGDAGPVSAQPAVDPDGKRIAFLNAPMAGVEQFSVIVMNLDGTGRRMIQTNSTKSGLPGWSRDGKYLSLGSGDDFPSLFVYDADGNLVRQVNPAGTGGVGGFWLPDGKTVGYARFMNGEKRSRIYLAKTDGSGEEAITDEDTLALSGPGGLAPDGKRLLYMSIDPQTMKGTLRLRDLEAKSESFLFEFDMDRLRFETIPFPAWAPDGKTFLFPLKTDKGTGLFRISEDGKTKTRLTPEGVDCLAGAWIPGK